MHVDLLFPSKYIKAADLKGKDVTKTIDKIEVDELKMRGGKSERKPVIYFSDSDKMLVLNKTNAMAIKAIHGAETDNWKGRRITMYPTTDRFGPQVVDCVRIRPSNPDGGTVQ